MTIPALRDQFRDLIDANGRTKVITALYQALKHDEVCSLPLKALMERLIELDKERGRGR
jgi:hypothetical protein